MKDDFRDIPIGGKNQWRPLTMIDAPPGTSRSEELVNGRGQILGFIAENEIRGDAMGSYVGPGQAMLFPFPSYDEARAAVEFAAYMMVTLHRSSDKTMRTDPNYLQEVRERHRARAH